LNGVAGALNALDPKALGIGVKLPANFQLYVVIQGETLSHLAQKFYGDATTWKRIHEANMDKIEHPDRIYAGQTLRIPVD
jgi:nucleoid-associated protein YgaU